jgi:hypothetical protein
MGWPSLQRYRDVFKFYGHTKDQDKGKSGQGHAFIAFVEFLEQNSFYPSQKLAVMQRWFPLGYDILASCESFLGIPAVFDARTDTVVTFDSVFPVWPSEFDRIRVAEPDEEKEEEEQDPVADEELMDEAPPSEFSEVNDIKPLVGCHPLFLSTLLLSPFYNKLF